MLLGHRLQTPTDPKIGYEIELPPRTVPGSEAARTILDDALAGDMRRMGPPAGKLEQMFNV